MKFLLDLNVVLDLVLDLAPWVDDAKRLTERVLSGELQAYVSATSMPTLFYVARRAAGPERALLAVQRCLATFEVVAVTRQRAKSGTIVFIRPGWLWSVPFPLRIITVGLRLGGVL